MSKKDRIDEAELGSVWCRDPAHHSMRENFSAEANCPGLELSKGLRRSNKIGQTLYLECYVMVGSWFDEYQRADVLDWSEPGRSRGFRRWYYLVDHGWIHESNLFGFFRRVA